MTSGPSSSSIASSNPLKKALRKVSFSNEKFMFGGDQQQQQVNGSGTSINESSMEETEAGDQRPNFLVGDDGNQDTNNNNLNNGGGGDLAAEDRDGFNQNFTTPTSRSAAYDLAEKRKRLR